MNFDNISLGDRYRALTDDELLAVSGGMRNYSMPLVQAFWDGLYGGACYPGVGTACVAVVNADAQVNPVITMTVIPGK